jgi:uncharacterized protein YecE (DUF72 family)
VSRLLAGSSGWSYPSWKPGFYPAGAQSEELLSLYAARLPAVELNATGYRLASAEQFARWGEQVPDGFRFAVKAPPLALRRPEVVAERVRSLGEQLGCVRVVLDGKRDDSMLERLVTAFAGTRLALDVRDESWADCVAGTDAVRVGDWEPGQGWCYLRFRDPPYATSALEEIAAGVHSLLDAEIDVYAFFRHEAEPTAPLAALELLDLAGRRQENGEEG